MGGFTAGITGYIIDIASGAIIEAFKPFNPLFVIYSIIFTFVSFLSGIVKAYYAGFFFSLGIISMGLLLNDFATILSGAISTSGFLFGFILSVIRD